ncbi:MAG: SDR family oxidoreductase [bacterium]|nr:SDR family oxidoreductase [bacterium]
MSSNPSILLTGATGYIGGRFLKRLEEKGIATRCLTRKPEYLRTHQKKNTEIFHGDVLDPDSLKPALKGVQTAYYLIHALGSKESFEEEEARGARNFARAAQAAGVEKIVYLGGLASQKSSLSKHLKSRHQVGAILQESGIPVLEFRASVILGSGSLSFEMVRSLVEKLPVMTVPKWVRVPAQPIFIEDVLDYLLAALKMPLKESRIYEIGGSDVVSYRDLMKEYARQRGLRRLMIPVPVLSPRISSLWLHLVTPIYARVGRRLIDSIRHPSVVNDPRALRDFSIKPMGIREAISRALKNEDKEFVQTHWSDSLSSYGKEKQWGGIRFKNRLVDSRTILISADPEAAFAPIQRMGGKAGWYYGNWLWQLRGWLDRLFGGVGSRRGRRDPVDLAAGDVLDFWRVELYEPPHKLVLLSEMKLPGRAWLEFEVEEKKPGQCEIRQTAIYDPIGLLGILYWYAVYPLHELIFSRMLKAIAGKINKRA